MILLGIVLINQKESITFELMRDTVLKNMGFLSTMALGFYGFNRVTIAIFDIEKYNLLLSCYEKNRLQAQYQNILESMDHAVIVDTTEGLQYFNSAGMKVLG